jgi:predicted DNA-binding protein
VPTRLSVEQYERLKQWCQANDFTMAVVLRGLIERFLDEQARRSNPGSGEADETSA